MAKLKFGVFLPFYAFKTQQSTEHFNQIKKIVLECERFGFDAVWLDDHLMYGDWPTLECWTLLSALASVTSKIRLGTMVSCSLHRNPALLAKTAATFDVISGGRLEFGIGAGTQEAEHEAYGFGFPKSKERVERLGEALEVVRALWTQKKATYSGKYYSLTNAVCKPKPLQKPHPTITVGGSGELLMRKVTARFAERFDWGFLPTIEEYKQRLEMLENDCRTVDRDFGEIEKSCWPAGQVLLTQNQSELSKKISRYKPANVSLEDFKKTTLAGTVDECVERLQVYRKLGVTYFMLYFADLPDTEGLRLFSEGVAEKFS